MENSSFRLMLLRNLINQLLLSVDKPLFFLFNKSKILRLLRCLFVCIFLIILRLVKSLPPFSKVVRGRGHFSHDNEGLVNSSQGGDTAIARAIYQVLSLVNNIPTSSRKYEYVRALAEKLIDENIKEGSEALRQVNYVVLSEAFGNTLSQLEASMLNQENNSPYGLEQAGFGLGRVVKAVKGWYRVEEDSDPPVEKTAAELMWLALKIEESGGGEVAVEKWAWARNMGWLALTAEPRVQATLVKLTAFLIKHAKDMGKQQKTGGRTEKQKQTNMKMLTTWLPLLCQASNGTDAPILSTNERGEIEGALEELIDMIQEEENREKVLSLWLHHFAQCSSSDWPNLHSSYLRWCDASRKLLLTVQREK